MTTVTKNFHLRVYGNFHYMDEPEAYNNGQYDAYKDPLIAAKAIVDEFFEHNWKRGITPGYLLGQYCLYREDPIILPGEHDSMKVFQHGLMRTLVQWRFVVNLKTNKWKHRHFIKKQ